MLSLVAFAPCSMQSPIRSEAALLRRGRAVLCCEQEDAWRARLARATVRSAELEVEQSRMSAIFSAAAEGRVTDEAATLESLRAIGGPRSDRYGEITPRGFAVLGSRIRLGAQDTFADLGSGIGKACVQSVAQFGVRSAIGVEYSPARHARALASLESVPASVTRRVALHCGDCAARSAWAPSGSLSSATVVWTCSALFDDVLMQRLARRLAESQVHTVATIRRFPGGMPGFCESEPVHCEMSWTAAQASPEQARWASDESDGALVHIYVRRTGADSQPLAHAGG